MEIIDFIVHFILNIDKELLAFINAYHGWVYLLLFGIVFVETGLVVMPFLPGDSLLFAVGMFAAQEAVELDITTALGLMLVAAILGDSCNYMIGKYIGKKILNWKLFGKQVVKQEYLDKTHAFYAKYGSKTIVIARFVPFARTFAPFVAGIGRMNQAVFLTWNILGALLWVVGIGLAGYFLGNIPVIQGNFKYVVLIIIFVSLLPVLLGVWKEWRIKQKEKQLTADIADAQSAVAAAHSPDSPAATQNGPDSHNSPDGPAAHSKSTAAHSNATASPQDALAGQATDPAQPPAAAPQKPAPRD